MRASEARKLIGKRVFWKVNAGSLHRPWTVECSGIFREVRGRNVCIDNHGSSDWLWLPDITPPHRVEDVTP